MATFIKPFVPISSREKAMVEIKLLSLYDECIVIGEFLKAPSPLRAEAILVLCFTSTEIRERIFYVQLWQKR
jgi:hypothetical protein